MNKNGWICLHRGLLDWEWYDDHNTTRLFIHLLLNVNFEQKKWRGITIKPGSILTGRLKLSAETGLSEKQIRTSLKKLEKTGEVAIKITSKYSIISVPNWILFQDKGQQRASKGPAKGHYLTMITMITMKQRKKKYYVNLLKPKKPTIINSLSITLTLWQKQSICQLLKN